MKPSTGAGIHSSLVGARHCAAQAVSALRTGAFSQAALAGYQEQWERELGTEFRDLRRLRLLFAALGDRGVDWALRLLAQPALQRVIANEGDIDFPGTMFASLARTAPEIITGLPMPWLDWALRWLRIGSRTPVVAGAD